MNFKQSTHEDILCPGQGCDDREDCTRWLVKGSRVGRWASFDIERMLTPNKPCPVKITPSIKIRR